MCHARRGFSILELMIVVALLGLLAAVAIPRLAPPPGGDHQAGLTTALSSLRTAVDSYRAQHGGLPGQDDVDQFTTQLCRRTSAAGHPGAGPDFDQGPYLWPSRIPMNPVLSTNTVSIVDTMPIHPMGPSAWLYDRSTGAVRANVRGTSLDGVRYFDL